MELLLIVIGLGIVISPAIYKFFREISYNNLEEMDEAYFRRKRNELGPEKYAKMLKKMQGAIEARIIADAEMGRKRNEKREKLLAFIQEERGKY